MEIYFDNCGTTKPSEIFTSNLSKFLLSDNYGNPSSLHKKGIQADKILKNAKNILASIFKCEQNEVIFTSGATQSNNIAILGVAYKFKNKNKNIITSSIEHPSVISPLYSLKKYGFEIIEIPPRYDGNFYSEDFIKKINKDTIMISMMNVNNETGSIIPIKKIADDAKKVSSDIIVHSDIVQSLGKININFNELKNIDIFTFSGHKLHSAKGIGGLIIRKNVKLNPVIFGGNQQNSILPGTENLPYIHCFSLNLLNICDNIEKNIEIYKNLYNHFIKNIDKYDFVKLGSFGKTVNHIINITVDKIHSEILVNFLSSNNVFVSSGSSCSKGKKSRILKEFNLSNDKLNSSIRISFSTYNTIEEINIFFDIINLAKGQILNF